MDKIERKMVYDRNGAGHNIEFIHDRQREVFEVRVDGEFYCTAENLGEAFEELTDILSVNNWTIMLPL